MLFALAVAPRLHDVNAQAPLLLPSSAIATSSSAPSPTTTETNKPVISIDIVDTAGKTATITVVPTEYRLLTTPL
jgi:hypothetical protein